ncbi:general transcription factor IIH subunit 5 [Dendropsophus ebraccatus]|uniref:general transcription factor IIH subunit 5 n=1 Tax=Dendropsophus ebraccatus TaxID=150705 RepID=UPI003831C5A1
MSGSRPQHTVINLKTLQVHQSRYLQLIVSHILIPELYSERRCTTRPRAPCQCLAVKMVNVLKGVLIECDPAMKQFLLYLDETNALGTKFIIQDLDETHVFVLAELVSVLQDKVGELMDQNSFPITQK